jgi:hypothetical protein
VNGWVMFAGSNPQFLILISLPLVAIHFSSRCQLQCCAIAEWERLLL